MLPGNEMNQLFLAAHPDIRRKALEHADLWPVASHVWQNRSFCQTNKPTNNQTGGNQMNTAAEEWTARVAARNEVEAAKALAATPAWVRRCRASRSAGALACCAVAIISCGRFPNYIAEMGDGSYRFVTPAMSRVFGAPSRVVVRRYLGCGDAVVLDNAEGRVALATLNDNLERVHGADVGKGGAE